MSAMALFILLLCLAVTLTALLGCIMLAREVLACRAHSTSLQGSLSACQQHRAAAEAALLDAREELAEAEDRLARAELEEEPLLAANRDLGERLARARRMNRNLKRKLEPTLAAPAGTSARELVQSGLPGEVASAIAQAPVNEIQRQQLWRTAELELIARGWPDRDSDGTAAGEVAKLIAEGDQGPDTDEEWL